MLTITRITGFACESEVYQETEDERKPERDRATITFRLIGSNKSEDCSATGSSQRASSAEALHPVFEMPNRYGVPDFGVDNYHVMAYGMSEDCGRMSDSIFDLRAVRALVLAKRPRVVVVPDTNLLMNWPDFARWKASLDDVIFVLPALINIELQRMKRRSQDKQGLDPASEAVRGYRDLCRKGVIHRGIYVDGGVWFVSVPLPMEDQVTAARTQWATVVKEYGFPDLMFLLLTMELAQTSTTPVVFATSDSGLFGLASSHGVPAYYFDGFPMLDLERRLSEVPPPVDVDLEKLWADMRHKAATTAMSAELTLTAKRAIPRSFGRTLEQVLEDIPLPESPLLFAEGVGTLRVDRDIPFSWALSYSEWDYPFLCSTGVSDFDPRPEFLGDVYLDFGRRGAEVPDHVKNALEQKLELLMFPFAGVLGLPTVCNPESILKFFFYITYVEESLSSKGGSEDDIKSEFAEEYRGVGDIADFGVRVIFQRLGVDPQEGRVGDSLRKILVALKESWSIGDTKVIQLST